jgi:hypothetical protein
MLEFIKTVASSYEISLRKTGRTTRLIKEAKATGSTIVCNKIEHAMQLKSEFGVETVSLEMYLNPSYHYGKRNKKYLFDNASEYVLIMDKLKEVEDIMSRKY